MNTDKKMKRRAAFMKERNLPSASKGCLLRGPEWAARLLLKFSSHAFIGVYRCLSVFIGGFQFL
jgi:hypothetical protein